MVFTNGLLEDSNRLESIIREVVNLNIIRRQRLRIEVTSRLELIYSHAVHSDTGQVHTGTLLCSYGNIIGVRQVAILARHTDLGSAAVQFTRRVFDGLCLITSYIGDGRHLRLCDLNSRRRQRNVIHQRIRMEVGQKHIIHIYAGQSTD